MSRAKAEIKEKSQIIRNYEGLTRDMDALKFQMQANEELRQQQK
jgi:hypothetical protein